MLNAVCTVKKGTKQGVHDKHYLILSVNTKRGNCLCFEVIYTTPSVPES